MSFEKRNSTMSESLEEHSRGSELLTWMLALALLFLNLQLLQDPWKLLSFVLGMMDVRSWTQTGWLIFTILLVGVLIAIRFGPEVRANWRDYRMNAAMRKRRRRRERDRQQQEEEKRKEHEHAREILERQGRLRDPYS